MLTQIFYVTQISRISPIFYVTRISRISQIFAAVQQSVAESNGGKAAEICEICEICVT